MRPSTAFCCFVVVIAGTQKYFVIDGQHKYQASQNIRRKLESENRPVPQWARRFRCRVLKAGLELEVLQKVAGREQARSQTVASMTFSQTMDWFLREVEKVRSAAERAGEPVVINRSDILRLTYDKTGKTTKYDGSVVCNLPPLWKVAHANAIGLIVILFQGLSSKTGHACVAYALLFVALFAPSQETWTKSCLVAAEFIIVCGKLAVTVLKRMEETTKVTGYTLKVMESLTVPEDWLRVAALMDMHEHKATASRLREVTMAVLRERWWSWCLLHPDLKDTHVHSSRRMFILGPASGLGCGCRQWNSECLAWIAQGV